MDEKLSEWRFFSEWNIWQICVESGYLIVNQIFVLFLWFVLTLGMD